MVMDLPTAARLPANWSCHKRWLMITTGSPWYRSSLDEKLCPRANVTPSVLKKFDETSKPTTCSGVGELVISKPSGGVKAAICSKERASRCQSRKSGYERYMACLKVRR